MIRPIAISLSPNTEFDDVVLSLKVLLNPFSWKSKRHTRNLERQFSEYLGDNHKAYALNSGRSAFYVGLKALNLDPGSEVVIQAFTCVVVPNAITWNNLKPVYVDIDDTYNVDPRQLRTAITKNTRAVVVQHTFGIPADIKQIKKIIKQKEKQFGTKIYLIEDCAHALGSTYDGETVGTLSDFSFFSFGRDKILSSVFGGIVATKDKELQKRIEKEYSELTYPSYWWIKQQVLHPLLFNFIILPLYTVGLGKVTVGKVLLFLFQKLTLLSKPVYAQELHSTKPSVFPQYMPGGLARLAIHQLSKLKRYNTARKHIAQEYCASKLGTEAIRAVRNSVWLRYPISVSDPRGLIEYAKHRGILLGNWYHNVLDPQCDLSVFGYTASRCPNAERLAKSVVNLPTYPLLSKQDTQTVISTIKTWQRTATKK